MSEGIRIGTPETDRSLPSPESKASCPPCGQNRTALLVEACHARFAGDVDRMLADADLGARIREKNRRSAKQRRREEDLDFMAAVDRIRARVPDMSLMAMALRLSDFADYDNVDPLQALAKRVARCLRRMQDASHAVV